MDELDKRFDKFMGELSDRRKGKLDENALFEIHSPEGHIWKIFPNGMIEGFPDGSMVYNRMYKLKFDEDRVTKDARTMKTASGLSVLINNGFHFDNGES